MLELRNFHIPRKILLHSDARLYFEFSKRFQFLEEHNCDFFPAILQLEFYYICNNCTIRKVSGIQGVSANMGFSVGYEPKFFVLKLTIFRQ